MDPGDKTAYDAASNTDGDTTTDTDEHA